MATQQGNAVMSGAGGGAAAGSIGGPWGALAGGAAGAISGLIGSAQGESEIDLAALYATIQSAGQYQQQIINALPAEVQKNLQVYAASQQAAGDTYAGQIKGLGENYLSQTKDLYGPNSEAAIAENAANRQQIYSTVPGTQNAIREALAATGGLSRGNAGAALAQPYINAAGQYGQAAANVSAQQAQAGQQATQQALRTVASMNETMFQELFGMNKEQAKTILTTGNAALADQLSQLILQSTNQTNQMLGVQGIAAQAGYKNALQQAGNQNAIYSGLANMSLSGATAGGWMTKPPGASGRIAAEPALAQMA